MVQIVKPQLFIVGQTEVNRMGLNDMLIAVGATGFKTDAKSGAEELAEIGGRLCYMSFNTDINPNVTRTREGNKPYIKNILSSGHGSVLESGTVNFVILNCTPVFTHELVRHRVGTAFSQRSGRFVRLDEIKFRWPDALVNDVTPEDAAAIREEGMALLEQMEEFQQSVAARLDMDVPGGMDFATKKRLTSAMRRFAGYGVCTDIMFSANHRALRHIIEVRNNVHAEEEPDQITGELASRMKEMFPAIYQDMDQDREGRWTFSHHKV